MAQAAHGRRDRALACEVLLVGAAVCSSAMGWGVAVALCLVSAGVADLRRRDWSGELDRALQRIDRVRELRQRLVLGEVAAGLERPTPDPALRTWLQAYRRECGDAAAGQLLMDLFFEETR